MTTLLLLLFPLLHAEPTIAELGWFTGCWEMTTARGHIEETWTRPMGETLLGMGRTVRDGKTVSTEFLQLSLEHGKLTYTAQIGTPNVTRFPLAKSSATELVFENPTHDFPQRILYRKSSTGLFARIEGEVKGKTRSQDFNYRPCK